MITQNGHAHYRVASRHHTEVVVGMYCTYRASYCTHAVLIIDMQTTVSLQCVLCTFDISILHQVSLLGKIDLTAEYPSNPSPSRAGVLMDVEV